jgi:hypothetical protein
MNKIKNTLFTQFQLKKMFISIPSSFLKIVGKFTKFSYLKTYTQTILQTSYLFSIRQTHLFQPSVQINKNISTQNPHSLLLLLYIYK